MTRVHIEAAPLIDGRYGLVIRAIVGGEILYRSPYAFRRAKDALRFADRLCAAEGWET
jgi:hypothetical protein